MSTSTVARSPRARPAGPARRLPASGVPLAWSRSPALVVLLSIVRAITGADDLTSSGTIGAALGPGGADRHGRPRRSLVRAVRRGQHRPRGHDDHGHLGSRLGRLPVGPVDRRPVRRRLRRGRRAAARDRHGHLRRRPHRLRCGDQHPRPRRHAVPLGDRLRGRAGRRASPSPRRSTTSPPSRSRACATPCSTLEKHHWFLVSDVAGIVRGLFTGVSLLTVRRRPAGGRHLLRALADGVRPAAAVLRREPGGRRVAGRERLPDEVRRGGRLRRVRRARRGVPRDRRRQRLPGGPDGRPRLHRPGGHDLRQLAARAGWRPAPDCSATPTRCSCAAAASRCTRCCCCSVCCSSP